jgi:hypothetical protein
MASSFATAPGESGGMVIADPHVQNPILAIPRQT